MPDSWLARGALLMVGGGPVSGSLSRLKTGVVLFLMRGACAIIFMSRGTGFGEIGYGGATATFVTLVFAPSSFGWVVDN